MPMTFGEAYLVFGLGAATTITLIAVAPSGPDAVRRALMWFFLAYLLIGLLGVVVTLVSLLR